MIKYQGETKWETITYHPQPIITVFKSPDQHKYWDQFGCTYKVIPQKESIIPHTGVKVEITYPEDYTEFYVEPLATYHKEFWSLLAEIHFDTYPFADNRRSKAYKLTFMGYDISHLLGNYYWELNYKEFTPEEWVNHLNEILSVFTIKVDSINEFVILFILSRKCKEEALISALNYFFQSDKIDKYKFARYLGKVRKDMSLVDQEYIEDILNEVK